MLKNGDTVALVPGKDLFFDTVCLRIINLEEWGRKFAKNKNAHVVIYAQCERLEIESEEYHGIEIMLSIEEKFKFGLKIEQEIENSQYMAQLRREYR